MNYVIDLSRTDAWEKAYSKDVRLVSLIDLAGNAIGSGDLVFLHLTDFMEGTVQDSYPEETIEQRRIKRFRQSVIAAAQRSDTPTLFFYSGDVLSEADVQGVVKSISTVSLPGVPAQRVQPVPGAIARSIGAAQLKEKIDAVITKVRHGKQINLSEKRPPDILTALALLCEAYALSMNEESNLPFLNKDQLEKSVRVPAWWRRPFQEFKEQKAFTAALEAEWGGDLPAGLAELVSRMFASETSTTASKARSETKAGEAFSARLIEKVTNEIGQALHF